MADTRQAGQLLSDWLEPKNHGGDSDLNEHFHSDQNHRGHSRCNSRGMPAVINATGPTRGDSHGNHLENHRGNHRGDSCERGCFLTPAGSVAAAEVQRRLYRI